MKEFNGVWVEVAQKMKGPQSAHPSPLHALRDSMMQRSSLYDALQIPPYPSSSSAVTAANSSSNATSTAAAASSHDQQHLHHHLNASMNTATSDYSFKENALPLSRDVTGLENVTPIPSQRQ